jgi:hypothetical protein
MVEPMYRIVQIWTDLDRFEGTVTLELLNYMLVFTNMKPAMAAFPKVRKG